MEEVLKLNNQRIEVIKEHFGDEYDRLRKETLEHGRELMKVGLDDLSIELLSIHVEAELAPQNSKKAQQLAKEFTIISIIIDHLIQQES